MSQFCSEKELSLGPLLCNQSKAAAEMHRAQGGNNGVIGKPAVTLTDRQPPRFL